MGEVCWSCELAAQAAAAGDGIKAQVLRVRLPLPASTEGSGLLCVTIGRIENVRHQQWKFPVL